MLSLPRYAKRLRAWPRGVVAATLFEPPVSATCRCHLQVKPAAVPSPRTDRAAK
jgi:hypothetical protein